jgi:hypothetical protein
MQTDSLAGGAAHDPDGGVRAPTRRMTVSLEPASAYEAVTRQMVLNLNEELREIKGRLNGLIFMVAGSLLLDVALRLAAGR